MLAITSCSSCPCGRAAGVPFGGRCPLVDRRRGRDELVCLEGEPASTVWFVKRGAVLLSRGGVGADRPRAIRGPGAFVGLEALVRSTYADSARTSEPSVLCAITRDDVDRWFGPTGTPARMALEQTLRVAAEDPIRPAAVDGSASQRVARWLLDEADHTPQVQRHVLAALLGMTPETLSRALARLRDDGAIELTRRLVEIRDRPRLERRALLS